MKFIISHSNTKREIDGTFSICASRDDIMKLVEQLRSHLLDSSWSYGWHTIHDEHVGIAGPAKGWDD